MAILCGQDSLSKSAMFSGGPALELDAHSAQGGHSEGTELTSAGGGGALGPSTDGGRLLLGKLQEGPLDTQPHDDPGSLGVGLDGSSIGESGYSTIGWAMGAGAAAPIALELEADPIAAPGADTAAPATAGLRAALPE